MILVIDNYDSFTYNLVQYLGELGAELVVLRNDEVTRERVETLNPERIVVSPGPCTPTEAGQSCEIIRTFSGRLPILGVCLGHQCIGEVFGGRVIRAPYLMHGKISEITHRSTDVFQNLPNPFIATRYHSLIVERSSLPDCLEITAETSDGLIMGLRHREHQTYGVQFHPESILTNDGKTLLKNFIDVGVTQLQ